MSTGDEFVIGSTEAPYENVSTKVLDVFRSGGSMGHVILSLQEFINELEDPDLQQRLAAAHITVYKTVNMLKTQRYWGDPVVLLMSMSPLVLQSVLLGTIAKDAEDPNREWPIATGPGIYAVGIAVDGRAGGFLNSHELETLADKCDQYMQDYRASNRPQQRVSRFAARVDRQIRPYPLPGFRSICSDADADRVQVFAQRLRVRAAAARRVDPSGSSIQQQSPLYVGCATNMEQRTLTYRGKPNFKNMNKLLGLTMNILFEMGLPCQAVPKPVMPIWESNQLDTAERLVSVLASSLVAQDGFNAIQTGGTVGNATTSTLAVHKLQILARQSWFEENLSNSRELFDSMSQFQDAIDELSRVVRGLTADVAELDAEVSALEARAEILRPHLESGFAEARRYAAERAEEFAEEKRRLNLVKEFVYAVLKLNDTLQSDAP